MICTRTELRFALLRSTLTAIQGFQGKWSDVHLQDLTDIDFSLIPGPTIIQSWTMILISMTWHQLYLWNKWLVHISCDFFWNSTLELNTSRTFMHLTLIGIMFAANITVTCAYPCLFNFIWWHHASAWKQLIHATHPTMVCGWIYISSRLVCINIVFCPCYWFLYWNVVLKCIALCLITLIFRKKTNNGDQMQWSFQYLGSIEKRVCVFQIKTKNTWFQNPIKIWKFVV